MQRDEYASTLCVCQFRAIVKRRIVIRLAREDHTHTLRFQRNAQQPRIAENNLTFYDPGRSAGARVRAAMRRIKNDSG